MAAPMPATRPPTPAELRGAAAVKAWGRVVTLRPDGSVRLAPTSRPGTASRSDDRGIDVFHPDTVLLLAQPPPPKAEMLIASTRAAANKLASEAATAQAGELIDLPPPPEGFGALLNTMGAASRRKALHRILSMDAEAEAAAASAITREAVQARIDGKSGVQAAARVATASAIKVVPRLQIRPQSALSHSALSQSSLQSGTMGQLGPSLTALSASARAVTFVGTRAAPLQVGATIRPATARPASPSSPRLSSVPVGPLPLRTTFFSPSSTATSAPSLSLKRPVSAPTSPRNAASPRPVGLSSFDFTVFAGNSLTGNNESVRRADPLFDAALPMGVGREPKLRAVLRLQRARVLAAAHAMSQKETPYQTYRHGMEGGDGMLDGGLRASVSYYDPSEIDDTRVSRALLWKPSGEQTLVDNGSTANGAPRAAAVTPRVPNREDVASARAAWADAHSSRRAAVTDRLEEAHAAWIVAGERAHALEVLQRDQLNFAKRRRELGELVCALRGAQMLRTALDSAMAMRKLQALTFYAVMAIGRWWRRILKRRANAARESAMFRISSFIYGFILKRRRNARASAALIVAHFLTCAAQLPPLARAIRMFRLYRRCVITIERVVSGFLRMRQSRFVACERAWLRFEEAGRVRMATSVFQALTLGASVELAPPQVAAVMTSLRVFDRASLQRAIFAGRTGAITRARPRRSQAAAAEGLSESEGEGGDDDDDDDDFDGVGRKVAYATHRGVHDGLAAHLNVDSLFGGMNAEALALEWETAAGLAKAGKGVEQDAAAATAATSAVTAATGLSSASADFDDTVVAVEQGGGDGVAPETADGAGGSIKGRPRSSSARPGSGRPGSGRSGRSNSGRRGSVLSSSARLGEGRPKPRTARTIASLAKWVLAPCSVEEREGVISSILSLHALERRARFVMYRKRVDALASYMSLQRTFAITSQRLLAVEQHKESGSGSPMPPFVPDESLLPPVWPPPRPRSRAMPLLRDIQRAVDASLLAKWQGVVSTYESAAAATAAADARK